MSALTGTSNSEPGELDPFTLGLGPPVTTSLVNFKLWAILAGLWTTPIRCIPKASALSHYVQYKT